MVTPSASPIDGRFDVFVVPRTGKLGLAWRLFRLKLRLPGRWNGVSLFRGRTVVVGHDGQRETLRVLRRALPLLLPPGSVAALERRQVDVEDEAPVETPPSSSGRLPSQPIATSTSSPMPTHTS